MAVVEATIDQLRRNRFGSKWTLILKEKKTDRYLPIYIGAAQAAIVKNELLKSAATSVALGLFLASVGATDSKVESVTIDRFEHNIFHAKLLLSCQAEFRDVSCPTAIALALAARADAPIFLEDEVLNKAALMSQ